MLVEFRVKNFRSIRDEQVFSLVASNDKSLKSNVYSTGINAIPSILKSAIIYGANASGKSNLIKALKYMRDVVLESATIVQPKQTYNLQPFKLDQGSATQATEFEITFLIKGVRHQYAFSMSQQRILSEYLLVYQTAKPQHWFNRYIDENTDEDVYEFKSGLKGSKQVWEEATRPNALFLSMASQLNSQSLKPIYDWFASNLVIFNESEKVTPDYTIKVIKEEDGQNKIRNFLEAANISIGQIRTETQRVPGKTFQFDLLADKAKMHDAEHEQHKILFHHVTESGQATFDFADESGGTRVLFTLAGPVLDILNKGKTLIIDELNASLHPLIVRELVSMFNDPKTNTGNAQLIFTTHDTSLMGATGLFRRDQIWFTEKGKDQATNLIAMAEFSPRKGEALERGYLSGRYGGIPFLDPDTRLRL
jgi:AAA15 family ATPase/GTPase